MGKAAPLLADLRPVIGRALAIVLVLPFVLLSLMAQGTMVIAGPTPPSFTVVLCGDHLPVEVVVDDDGSLITADEYQGKYNAPIPKTPKAPCDWSAHSHPMLDAASPMLGAQLPVMLMAEVTDAHDQRILRAEVLAPAARGPPAA